VVRMARATREGRICRAGGGVVAADIEAVGRGIEHWRETREKRSPMPEELWAAAVSAAREHGIWAVSRALRVNYESLRSRVQGRARRGRAATSGASGFVELDGAQVLGAAEGGTATLELSRPDGASLTIRLEGCGAVDLSALAEVFWRSNG